MCNILKGSKYHHCNHDLCANVIPDLLKEMMQDVQPQDMVRLSLNSTDLNHEIWIPFMNKQQLSADRVMAEVDK